MSNHSGVQFILISTHVHISTNILLVICINTAKNWLVIKKLTDLQIHESRIFKICTKIITFIFFSNCLTVCIYSLKGFKRILILPVKQLTLKQIFTNQFMLILQSSRNPNEMILDTHENTLNWSPIFHFIAILMCCFLKLRNSPTKCQRNTCSCKVDKKHASRLFLFCIDKKCPLRTDKNILSWV